MRYQFIYTNQEVFKTTLMCDTLKVSRSGYYSWRVRPESKRKKASKDITHKIRVIHGMSRKTYGSPRIHAHLAADGITCGLNRVARLMRQAGIRAKTVRKFKATTNSRHNLPVAPNLLEKRFYTNVPNQVWVADITYIPTREGWLYLAAIMDIFSRMVIGWSMDSRMCRGLVINALRMALLNRKPTPGLIHHSDRGSQYASYDYQYHLSEYRIRPSMSGKGDCYDNAVQESFFKTLKTELVYHCDYQTRDEAKKSIFEYIEVFYNRQRRHSFIGYMSPAEFEALNVT